MRRGAALYLVGSLVLLTLAGCGRGWMGFQQRDAWRSEAERECVRSGAVKAGATVVPVRAIDGPGVCGAEHPFKVAALGDRTVLGYLREMRPPGDIPGGFPIPEPRRTAPASPPYGAPPYGERPPRNAPARYDSRPGHGEPPPPLSLHPPGIEGAEEDEPEAAEGGPPGAGPYADRNRYPPPARGYPSRSVERAPLGAQGDPYRAAPGAPERLGPDRAPVTVGSAAVKPEATLACPLVSRLDQWMAAAVQPAAMRWFGQPVAEIRQISAYSCRGMNGQRGAPISEHAFGNALDIAAFTLADGRRITVKNGWRGAAEEQGFLRDVHAAACEHFSTVLAPGSNRFHYDHIHVDLARRRSGRTYCNPQAVAGEVIARRAAGRTVTGSVGGSGRMGYAAEGRGDAAAPQLPRAIPGAD